MGIGNKEPRGLWYVSHSFSRQTTLIIAKSGETEGYMDRF